MTRSLVRRSAMRFTSSVTSGPTPSPGSSNSLGIQVRSAGGRALDRALGADVVGEEAPVGNPEAWPGGAPGGHVRGGEVGVERSLVTPALEHVDQARLDHVLGVVVVKAAILVLTGGHHRRHLRPQAV